MHNRTGIGILIGIEIQVNPIWYFIIHWNYDKNDRNNPDLIHRIIYERHWPQPMDGVWVISHDPKRGFTHQQTNTDMVIEFTTFNTNLSLIHLLFLYDDDLNYIYINYIYIFIMIVILTIIVIMVSYIAGFYLFYLYLQWGWGFCFIRRSGLAIHSSRRGWPRGGDDSDTIYIPSGNLT